MTPTVSIVVPTHNRAARLRQTLLAIDSMLMPNGTTCEVIVVANGCTDETVEITTRHSENARLTTVCVTVPSPGLNPARNVGLDRAKGEYILYLDDDVRAEPSLISAMITAYREHSADLVGGRVSLLWEAIERPAWLPEDLLWVLSNAEMGNCTQESVDGRGIIGACFGFHRRVADSIGRFRDGLDRVGDRLLGGGESDFVQRALRRGFRAYHVPEMHVRHWVAPNRVTLGYMLGVSHGCGESRIYIKPSFTLQERVRAFAGHLWLYAYHTAAASMTWDSANRLRHQCTAAAGLGGLRGCLLRCLGKQPVAPLSSCGGKAAVQ